jgi:hypothetical protein
MNVLLFGAGSKWGAHFTRYLADNGCKIDLITSKNFQYHNVNTIPIDWNSVDMNKLKEILLNCKNKTYDLIFFNQNSGGNPNDTMFIPGNILDQNNWNKSFWVDVQLPYYAIKILNQSIVDNTKIGWMLTGLINGHDSKFWKYAGYAAAKTANLNIMRGFSQASRGIFFCINPIWFPENQTQIDCESIHTIITSLVAEDNGKIFTKEGVEWSFFRKIY